METEWHVTLDVFSFIYFGRRERTQTGWVCRENRAKWSLVYIFDLVSGASELLDLWLLEKRCPPPNHVCKTLQRRSTWISRTRSRTFHTISGFERPRTDPGSALLEGTLSQVHHLSCGNLEMFFSKYPCSQARTETTCTSISIYSDFQQVRIQSRKVKLFLTWRTILWHLKKKGRKDSRKHQMGKKISVVVK